MQYFPSANTEHGHEFGGDDGDAEGKSAWPVTPCRRAETLLVSLLAATIAHLYDSGSMTMDPPPDLADLVWLFEAEPRWPYAEDLSHPYTDAGYEEQLWPYTAAIFRLQRQKAWVEMEIHPDHHKVCLTVATGEDRLTELELGGVQSVTADRLSGREYLRIDFCDHTVAEPLWLRTKPTIGLRWAVGPGPKHHRD